MHGKKPVSKASKPKRPINGKGAARRAEVRKTATAGHRPAAVAKTTSKAGAGAHAERAAGERAHPERAHAERPAAVAANAHGVHAQPSRERIRPGAVLADTAADQSLADAVQTAANDADESDSPEPGSLLAGPRNVKPYVARRGEQYMSKSQLAHFQQILSNWKRDLMEEVDRTVSHMKDEAANFPDPNDRATQEEEFSLELRTRDRERKLIRKIDEALKRIEDGTYGYCLETGEEIGIKRLEARPVATLSIEAQERRERRERQYGDRDDRYR
jgi:DnaK suppressor protein